MMKRLFLFILFGCALTFLSTECQMREIRHEIGQHDVDGCANACTAFAFAAAVEGLDAASFEEINVNMLAKIVGHGCATYMKRPKHLAGCTAADELIEVYNQIYPEKAVTVDQDAAFQLLTTMAPEGYMGSQFDFLREVMRVHGPCAAVITVRMSPELTYSYAFCYRDGIWLFYDSHSGHRADGFPSGSYACLFSDDQAIPENIARALNQLFVPTGSDMAFQTYNVTATFLSPDRDKRAAGAALAVQEGGIRMMNAQTTHFSLDPELAGFTFFNNEDPSTVHANSPYDLAQAGGNHFEVQVPHLCLDDSLLDGKWNSASQRRARRSRAIFGEFAPVEPVSYLNAFDEIIQLTSQAGSLINDAAIIDFKNNPLGKMLEEKLRENDIFAALKAIATARTMVLAPSPKLIEYWRLLEEQLKSHFAL